MQTLPERRRIKYLREIAVCVLFPFLHKNYSGPDQLAEIISIPKSLPSLNMDLKKIFSYILFYNDIFANFYLLGVLFVPWLENH